MLLDLVRVVAPAADVVTVAELKAQVRLLSSEEDAVLRGYLDAATGHLDGYAGVLGRALVAQTWVLHLAGFPACGRIELPLAPLISVGSVAYVDADGATQTLSASVYEAHAGPRAELTLADGQSWPSTAARARAVSVTFTAGYGAAGEDVPAPLRLAVTLQAAAYDAGRVKVGEIDPAVLALIGPYRRIRI